MTPWTLLLTLGLFGVVAAVLTATVEWVRRWLVKWIDTE